MVGTEHGTSSRCIKVAAVLECLHLLPTTPWSAVPPCSIVRFCSPGEGHHYSVLSALESSLNEVAQDLLSDIMSCRTTRFLGYFPRGRAAL